MAELICPECGKASPDSTLMCKHCNTALYRSRLKISIEGRRGETLYLFPRDYKIGRGPENDIVIRDISVSRFHAELEFKNGEFSIIDIDSKNGSLLNNHHFKKSKLNDSDCIQLGNALLYFYDESSKQLLAGSPLRTEEFVQREFLKFSKSGETKVSTQDVLLTMLDLLVSLTHASVGMILHFNEAGELEFRHGKDAEGRLLANARLAKDDWLIINTAIREKSLKIEYAESKSGSTDRWERVAVPLVAGQINDDHLGRLGKKGVVGVGFLKQTLSDHPITASKLDLLKTLTYRITQAIENEFLYGVAEVQKKLNNELQMARDIQRRLLPTEYPDIRDLEIASFVEPCEIISGDYFEIMKISNSKIGLAIGDICGKGIPAALLSSTVQAAIRSQIEFTTSSGEIITNLNRLLIKSTAESIFLTIFFGILDLSSSVLRYVNAGHPPPVIVSKGHPLNELSATSPPLGIVDSGKLQESEAFMMPGDTLILYTDGIIESRDRNKAIFGRQRLLRTLEEIALHPKKTPPLGSIVAGIKQELKRFIQSTDQSDDLTLLAIRRKQTNHVATETK